VIEVDPSVETDVICETAGNLRELRLERLRHRGGHGFRTGAGELRGDLKASGSRPAAAAPRAGSDRRTMPTNSKPTISSDVAIGYRMNGSEMLSAMVRAPWRPAAPVQQASRQPATRPVKAWAARRAPLLPPPRRAKSLSGAAAVGERAGVGAAVGCTCAPSRNGIAPPSPRFRLMTDPA